MNATRDDEIEDLRDAIIAAIAFGLEGDAIAGIDLLIERFPELADRGAAIADIA